MYNVHVYVHVHGYAQGENCVGIFPGFALNVVISGTAVKFEPDPSGFEVSGITG